PRVTRVTCDQRPGSAVFRSEALPQCCSHPKPSEDCRMRRVTPSAARAVAEVVTTDAASLVGGATLDEATGMPFAMAPMPGAPAMAPSSATCSPTRTPSPVTNSDGDPVPDSVRVDFTGCTFSGE